MVELAAQDGRHWGDAYFQAPWSSADLSSRRRDRAAPLPFVQAALRQPRPAPKPAASYLMPYEGPTRPGR
jgi:hypothetical protein